jgi:hypothetical protein
MSGDPRHTKSNDDDELWNDATEVLVAAGGVVLQVVGTDSPINVAFVRIKGNNGDGNSTLHPSHAVRNGQAVDGMLELMLSKLDRQSSVSVGKELFRLGSVWILSKPSPIRATLNDFDHVMNTALRVHWNPRRYPEAEAISPDSILHEVSTSTSTQSLSAHSI